MDLLLSNYTNNKIKSFSKTDCHYGAFVELKLNYQEKSYYNNYNDERLKEKQLRQFNQQPIWDKNFKVEINKKTNTNTNTNISQVKTNILENDFGKIPLYNKLETSSGKNPLGLLSHQLKNAAIGKNTLEKETDNNEFNCKKHFFIKNEYELKEDSQSMCFLIKNQSENENIIKTLNTSPHPNALNYRKNLEFFMDKNNENDFVNNFKSVGIFSLENNDKTQKIYLDVLHRTIEINEGKTDYLEDYFFYDITDLMNYKHYNLEENIKKQKILAKIAHEFKTPLNSIISTIEGIKDSAIVLSQPAEDKLEIIRNLSNYVSFLISDIIHYANITDTTDIRIHSSVINITKTLGFCFDILNTLINCNKSKRSSISVHLHIDDIINYCEIKTDEIRLKQILLNFISNAVKFTKAGSIKLKCKKIFLQNKNFIIISVKDTGIGIKEENIKTIGKDFMMYTDREGGVSNALESGLGLNICLKLIQRMNFIFDFKSLYRKGSTFSILIPENSFKIKDAAEAAKAAIAGSKHTRKVKNEYEKENENILNCIAEQNAENTNYTSDIKPLQDNEPVAQLMQIRKNSFDSLDLTYLKVKNKIILNSKECFESGKVNIETSTKIIHDLNSLLHKDTGIKAQLKKVMKYT